MMVKVEKEFTSSSLPPSHSMEVLTKPGLAAFRSIAASHLVQQVYERLRNRQPKMGRKS